LEKFSTVFWLCKTTVYLLIPEEHKVLKRVDYGKKKKLSVTSSAKSQQALPLIIGKSATL
jgi:hypothetical protein